MHNGMAYCEMKSCCCANGTAAPPWHLHGLHAPCLPSSKTSASTGAAAAAAAAAASPLPTTTHLVRPADEVQVLPGEKLRHAVGPKGVADAPVVLAPALDVLVRVSPQQVAQQAAVGHVRGPRDALDLLQGLELWGQAAVHAQDLQRRGVVVAGSVAGL